MLNADSLHNYIAGDSEIETQIEDVENELYYDIDDLLRTNYHPLYRRDRFRFRKHIMDIISPGSHFHEYRSIFKGPDYIRFLLSLYPFRNDLLKVETVLLRPRHIEVNGTELASLYIRKGKILVLYLHSPFMYRANYSGFSEYSNLLSSGLLGLSSDQEKEPSTDIMIPPLWYYLSNISISTENTMEKFFLKRKCVSDSWKLSDISFRYSRLGY